MRYVIGENGYFINIYQFIIEITQNKILFLNKHYKHLIYIIIYQYKQLALLRYIRVNN